VNLAAGEPSPRAIHDFDHIASHMVAYQRLVEHWRTILPAPLLDIAYEETVAEKEGVARRVASWHDAAWDGNRLVWSSLRPSLQCVLPASRKFGSRCAPTQWPERSIKS
jgi:hypothetical protein